MTTADRTLTNDEYASLYAQHYERELRRCYEAADRRERLRKEYWHCGSLFGLPLAFVLLVLAARDGSATAQEILNWVTMILRLLNGRTP